MNRKNIFAIMVVLTLLSTSIAPLATAVEYPYTFNNTEVVSALNFLREQQQPDGSIGGFSTSAWVTMAIAAAGEDPYEWRVSETSPSIVDYLRDNADQIDMSKATDVEKLILAITASGENPADFGNADYVGVLESFYGGGQIGDASLLNDDFWGVLALISAGVDPNSEAIQNTIIFIKNNQNADGGWSWNINGPSDVDDTSAAIMALMAAGKSPDSDTIQNALNFLKINQADNGGFISWDSSNATNSATDSWAIQAIVAVGQDPATWTKINGTPIDDLLSFQNLDGSFSWTLDTSSNKVMMTAYALPALLGKAHPVVVQEQMPQQGVSVYVRVEGRNSTIWRGDVIVTNSTIVDDIGVTHILTDSTALGALDEASNAGGFNYVVKDSAWGMYVYSIGGEEPEGWNGWMYMVDYYVPMCGADVFILDETQLPAPPHEEVLFYWGGWGECPLRIAIDATEVYTGEEFTASVIYFDDTSAAWVALTNATIYVSGNDYITDDSGTVTVSIQNPGAYEIFAEKEGYIRSDKVKVMASSPQPQTSSQVMLTAQIMPAVSISVMPNVLNFGKLGPGYVSTTNITVSNMGSWNVDVMANVTDSTGLYARGLWLNDASWEDFSASIDADSDDFENNIFLRTELRVPVDYEGVGVQNGTLIFWATPAGMP